MPKVDDNYVFCDNCNEKSSLVVYGHKDLRNCSNCGESLGYPNVNLSNRPTNIKELNKQYTPLKNIATPNKLIDKINELEKILSNQSKVVLCSSLKFTIQFFNNNLVYLNYRQQLEQGLINVKDIEDDYQREYFDNAIYGSTIGKEINYAALSINEQGLKSYGNCHWVLNTKYINKRLTLIPDDSFKVFKAVGIPRGKKLNGYIANWQNKHKLAIVKLFQKIGTETTEVEFAELLLSSNGNKEEDNFIEVHIYGKFKAKSVEKVVVSNQFVSKNKRRKGQSGTDYVNFNIIKLKDALKDKLEIIDL